VTLMRYTLFLVLLGFYATPAFSEEALPAVAPETAEQSAAPELPPPPTLVIPAQNPANPGAPAAQAPVVAAPSNPLQPQAGYFPQLPPSRPCARPDADGFWKLKYVFENPVSSETLSFRSQPHQYILFLRDDTYKTHKAIWADKTETTIKTQMMTETPPKLQQFVVHESGFIYFYNDGVAVDTQACFIVANSRGEFKEGQMLLMPPEGQSPTRLVKVYESIDEDNQSSSGGAPPPRQRRPRR
jgi:hypothetical protein